MIIKACWAVTALACVAACAMLLTCFRSGLSGHQTAVISTMALALANIPYVLTRCFERFSKRSRGSAQLAAQL